MTQSSRDDKRDELTEWLRGNAPDCGDNSCLFGGRGKGGMRTNGGCRCFKDVRPDMKRIFIERMWAAICVPSSTAPQSLCGFKECVVRCFHPEDCGYPFAKSATALPFHVPPERFNEVKARVLCDWPQGKFTLMDDPDPHKPCYLVLPDGACVGFAHHDGDGVDKARVRFIVDACNAALLSPNDIGGE